MAAEPKHNAVLFTLATPIVVEGGHLDAAASAGVNHLVGGGVAQQHRVEAARDGAQAAAGGVGKQGGNQVASTAINPA